MKELIEKVLRSCVKESNSTICLYSYLYKDIDELALAIEQAILQKFTVKPIKPDIEWDERTDNPEIYIGKHDPKIKVRYEEDGK